MKIVELCNGSKSNKFIMIQGQYRQVNDPNFLTKIIKTSKETLISYYRNFFYSKTTI